MINEELVDFDKLNESISILHNGADLVAEVIPNATKHLEEAVLISQTIAKRATTTTEIIEAKLIEARDWLTEFEETQIAKMNVVQTDMAILRKSLAIFEKTQAEMIASIKNEIHLELIELKDKQESLEAKQVEGTDLLHHSIEKLSDAINSLGSKQEELNDAISTLKTTHEETLSSMTLRLLDANNAIKVSIYGFGIFAICALVVIIIMNL